MSFSAFLDSRRSAAKALVAELHKDYSFVSVLGSDIQSNAIRVNKNSATLAPGMDTECGFVVKMNHGGVFFEYSLDDISGDIPQLADKIRKSFARKLTGETITGIQLPDEQLVQSFRRESDFADYTDSQLLDFCTGLCKDILTKSEHLLNVTTVLSRLEVSKLFVSPNRELDQNYTWVNGMLIGVYKDGEKIVQPREFSYDHTIGFVMRQLPTLGDKLVHKAACLVNAKPIVPGVYDVITDPSITGLIAHEAFGHGVEMDQFVKDRALAKSYVGDYVASPICNMKDGAASALSVASYFFDDDGVLAGDTQIIKDGILITGISDLGSAVQLGTKPTGNGRRESTRHKAYTRMTNTFFEKGTDKLEDMIASVKHGYMPLLVSKSI